NARGLGCDIAEEGEGRRQPALALVKMVLRDPGGIESRLFGAHDLLGGEAVALGRRGLIEQAREESQTFQVCKAFHTTPVGRGWIPMMSVERAGDKRAMRKAARRDRDPVLDLWLGRL